MKARLVQQLGAVQARRSDVLSIKLRSRALSISKREEKSWERDFQARWSTAAAASGVKRLDWVRLRR